MILTVWNFLLTTGLCVIQFTSALVVDKTSTSLTNVPQDINVLATDLKLDSNYITRITNSSFVLYTELRILRLKNNDWLIDYAPNTVTIGLSRNTITEIPREQLVGNLALQKLYLQQNKVSTIPDLYHLPLTDLYLDRNPLVCDSALCWIRMRPWMETSLITDAITCETPDTLQYALLMDINPITLACQTGRWNWKSIDKIIYRLETG